VHGPIDDDLYPYYRELGDEVGLLAISDRQHELAPDLNSIGRVHNARRIDEWSLHAGKGDYALFPWPVRRATLNCPITGTVCPVSAAGRGC
jgi:hypothetical protein